MPHAPARPGQDQTTDLVGRTILVVEDEYLIAAALAQALTAARARVLGPASSEVRAREIMRGAGVIDCAILDIDLGGHQAWGVVDDLVAAGVVVVLASGYGASAIPDRHLSLARSGKPVELQTVARALRQNSVPGRTVRG